MHDVAVAQELVRQIVPRDHRSVKEWISATAHSLGWSYNRTKNIWYGEARRIDGFEKDALRGARSRAFKKQREIEELKRERREIIERLDVLEKALAVAGPVSPGKALVPHSEDTHPVG